MVAQLEKMAGFCEHKATSVLSSLWIN